jgi:DNA-binding CsgD family transcriptional regulator
MSLPVAMRLFFLRTRSGSQALFFGIAVSAGHLCWSLLAPLVAHMSAAPETLAGGLGNRYLPLLNIARNLAQLLFTGLCLYLARPEAAGGIKTDRAPHQGRFPAQRFGWLLLPFLACFFLNGFTGYLFFPRVMGRGLYTEYMHLALVLLIPLAGLWLSRQGDAALFRLLGSAALSFAVFPLLLFLPEPGAIPPWASQAVFLICAPAQQILLYGGVLAFARFAQASRVPALAISTVWLAAFVSVPGRLLAGRLVPALGLSLFPAVCVLAALCLLSLLALRKAFPLPEPPAEEIPPDRPLSGAGSIGALADKGKLAAFAGAFGLSGREIQVLDGLLRQQPLERISGELGVRESTVRYHQTGLFKKTGQGNRKLLTLFYAAWKAK